jgi:hypothetical protein
MGRERGQAQGRAGEPGGRSRARRAHGASLSAAARIGKIPARPRGHNCPDIKRVKRITTRFHQGCLA